MKPEDITDDAKAAFQYLKHVAEESNCTLDDIGNPKQLLKFAAEHLPKGLHPLVALWIVDAILENGKNIHAVLWAADSDNMSGYRSLVRYIRRLALKEFDIDIHCGENGLEVIELEHYEALLLSESLRQAAEDECRKNDYKILEALNQ